MATVVAFGLGRKPLCVNETRADEETMLTCDGELLACSLGGLSGGGADVFWAWHSFL